MRAKDLHQMLFCLSALSLSFFKLSNGIAQDQGQSLPDHVTTAWQETRSKLTGVVCKYEYTRTVTVNGEVKLSVASVNEFGAGGPSMFTKKSAQGAVDVNALNPDYGFSTSENAETKRYKLNQYRTGPLTQQVRSEIAEFVEPILFAGVQIMGKPLDALVNSEYCAISSYQEDEASKTATLEFAYLPPDKERDTAITGGTVKLDLSRQWIIKDFKCPAVWGSIEGSVEYKDFEGLMVPAHYQTASSGAADNSLSVDTYKLIEVRRFVDGKEPVNLKDYGLDQPAELFPIPDDKRTPNWILWINVVFVACLVFAYFMFSRRRSTR